MLETSMLDTQHHVGGVLEHGQRPLVEAGGRVDDDVGEVVGQQLDHPGRRARR